MGRGWRELGRGRHCPPRPAPQPSQVPLHLIPCPSSSQWMQNGLPGPPGPRALSHAGAPGPGSDSATHPRTGAGPVPCCPGTLTAPTRLVSGGKEDTKEGVRRGCWWVACPLRGSALDGLPFGFLSGPCPQDGCPNVTCSRELVFHPCAPCPLTCDDISGQAVCPPDPPCSSPGKGAQCGVGVGMSPEAKSSGEKPHPGPSLGCWCPTGQVLDDKGRCVWPGQCPCLVDGIHYPPGQRIKADCQLCICQDGRPRRCRPNLDCAGEALSLALPQGVSGLLPTTRLWP